MPKIVDHDRRREELSDAVLSLVATNGIGGVTLRSVAKESGWSTGVIGHYFRNRHDMLLSALRRAAVLQGEYFTRTKEEGGTPMQRVRNLLLDVLPLDERRMALSHIFLFFYAEGAQDEVSRQEMSRYLQNWRRAVARALTAAVEEGELAPDTDVEAKAMYLVACTDGLSNHAVLDPEILQRIRDDPDAVVDGFVRASMDLV